MPIINDEITFIHIPKCGGTSIIKYFMDSNVKVSLVTDSLPIYIKNVRTNSVFINGHTPQHCTYRELSELGLLKDKIFAIVRPFEERVVSEYYYILDKRPDLKKLFSTFDEFLDLFLNTENYLLFDYHNLPDNQFLMNHDGIIEKKIKVFDFFDKEAIEDFLGIKGLQKENSCSLEEKIVLNELQLKKIKEFYEKNS